MTSPLEAKSLAELLELADLSTELTDGTEYVVNIRDELVYEKYDNQLYTVYKNVFVCLDKTHCDELELKESPSSVESHIEEAKTLFESIAANDLRGIYDPYMANEDTILNYVICRLNDDWEEDLPIVDLGFHITEFIGEIDD